MVKKNRTLVKRVILKGTLIEKVVSINVVIVCIKTEEKKT